MKFKVALLLLALCVWGCGSSGTKYDLSTIEGKATVGMTELQLTSAIGAPTSIKVVGDTRTLRFESKDGKGALVVTLKSNIVIDTKTEP